MNARINKNYFVALLFVCLSFTYTPNLRSLHPKEKSTTSTAAALNALNQYHKMEYLALGDSYTIGERVETSDRWSAQLVSILEKKGKSITTLDIIARTGWTTAELLEGIQASGNKKKYSLVSLLIGVNNQYRGQSVDVYRKEFKTLLNTAISFASGKPERVFVLSIPDWGVTPHGKGYDRDKVARAIDSFNQVAEEECRHAGILFINITDLSRQAAYDASLIASDDLHFSGVMYRLWAIKALPFVEKMLE